VSNVSLNFTSWERILPGFAASVLRNRFFEQNPSQREGVSLIARPGTPQLGAWGTGKVRGFFSLPGLFNGALFVVSGETLYRIEPDLSSISITGIVFGTGAVSMAGIAGAGYERLFVADGSHLQFYGGGVQASGVLTGTGHVVDGDTIEVGGTYYQWTATITDGAGTVGNPWKVLIGANLQEDLENMVKVISFVGTPGTDWSANLGGQNGDITATSDATTLTATARTDLAAGNLLTTSETSANLSWAAVTLLGGGVHGLSGVEVPDGLPPVSITVLKSYVIVALGNTDRFYFIEPGAVVIDPLNFATAESQPDDTLDVVTIGDTVMFVGEGSTEVWYPTGDQNNPFAPVAGRVYDRGGVEGTVVNVKGQVFLVGPENVVYAIGGSAARVSNHGVEEMIRLALGA